ncbi:YaeQ family protein [Geoalkalibacter halelectricus]|uniref:YaeQ family protein n=1 Tax=Geoalkalibacter halelectricus TaxID=2847045 RepID=A0ABY5ZJW6_9BACT|nr:YaeQ family protein [Geoalkalibacter halelectricus]MDO3380199.1 YaeQ family protein [Geoalkalibacter halelectricus]UWZ78230.1 YaeQ family protein [Geoalkalibacter halelectricus]
MALPSTIHRAVVQLSDVDRGVYETLQATLARHPSETAQRLVLRLLAYAVCYEPELSFTKGICAGDEPDLWSKEPDDRVRLWIEVGTPEPERLLKAARHAARVVLLAAAPSRFRWDALYREKLGDATNIQVIGVDYAFVNKLAEGLERTISWELTISDATLYLTSAGQSFETTLEILVGSAD